MSREEEEHLRGHSSAHREALVAHQTAAWAAREIALIELRALGESIQGTNGTITADLVGEARDEREKERVTMTVVVDASVTRSRMPRGT